MGLETYRKIPKISPSMYKPLQTADKLPKLLPQKTHRLNRASKYKPLRDLYLEIALKYRVNQSKNGNFLPTIRLAQFILKRKFPSIDKPLQN